MATLREIKRQARLDLHKAMTVAAVYIAPGGATTDVTVRLHTKFKALGDGEAGAAEMRDTVPKIVLLRSEISPVRHAVISVEAGEAYRIDHLDPPDDITITAAVTPLSASETTGLPVPGV